jgi:ornithine cyclodeaminase/alanine dehydrogenase-like protein (mu-crystallin family)
LKFDVTVDGNTCQTYKNVPASRLGVTAKADSGDLVEACQTRIARWEDVVPLEKIVAEDVPQPRPKRILFQSNGIADEDLAVGKYVLDQAKRKKLKLREVTEI